MKHINLNFTLTNNCNFKCSYCIQGSLQTRTKILDIKVFRNIIVKIFKEVKKYNFETMDITLMGGELSTNNKFLEYFKLLFKYLNELNIKVSLNFLSNLSGNLSFFKELLKYQNDNISLTLIGSIHSEFKSIKKLESIYKLYRNLLELSFLEDKVYAKFKDFIIDNNIVTNFIDIREPLANEKKIKNIKICNAQYFNIFPDGEIKDVCRNFKFNYRNFKIINKEIKCNKECPCPFLANEFKSKEL